MPGTGPALFVIPIAATIGMVSWLTMVYYVGRHPFWRGTPQSSYPAGKEEHRGRRVPSAAAEHAVQVVQDEPVYEVEGIGYLTEPDKPAA